MSRMEKFFTVAVYLFVCLAGPGIARAEYFYLKSGDRISGDILESTDEYFRIKMYYIEQEITLKRDLISRMESNEEHAKALNQAPPAPGVTAANPIVPVTAPAPKYWENKLSAGYQVSNGNSKNTSAHLHLDSHYKKDRNEWFLKGQWDYGSDRGKMNMQKYYGRAQSNSRLAGDTRWFYSRSLEINHDRFANIDYRVLPSLGMGYWFIENDKSKAEVDFGAGWEYTNYGDPTKSTSNATFIPHAYFDKMLVGRMKFAQDLTIYPSLADIRQFRVRSDSSLINPITDKLSWKLSLIDEFNTEPGGDFKKNDITFISSLEYAF